MKEEQSVRSQFSNSTAPEYYSRGRLKGKSCITLYTNAMRVECKARMRKNNYF